MDLSVRFGDITDADGLADILTLRSESVLGRNEIFTGLRLKAMAYSTKTPAYISFEIPKKSGGTRHISAPNRSLKRVQKILNAIFRPLYEDNGFAKGFLPGLSVADNAYVHIKKGYVFNIDLKDFFPSISEGRIFRMLQHEPFRMQEKVASLVACLCCEADFFRGKRDSGHLPQGAPTSPILTNFVCRNLDRKLGELAESYKVSYSRYADDITFSSDINRFGKNGKFYKEVAKIIEEESFVINESKVRVQGRGYRQEVTGVIVNEKTNVPSKYLKDLRFWIHCWEKFGYEKANASFKSDREKHGKKPVSLQRVMMGKLLYMKMLKGQEDSTFAALSARYQALLTPDIPATLAEEAPNIEEALSLLPTIADSANESPDISIERMIWLLENKGLDYLKKLK